MPIQPLQPQLAGQAPLLLFLCVWRAESGREGHTNTQTGWATCVPHLLGHEIVLGVVGHLARVPLLLELNLHLAQLRNRLLRLLSKRVAQVIKHCLLAAQGIELRLEYSRLGTLLLGRRLAAEKIYNI